VGSVKSVCLIHRRSCEIERLCTNTEQPTPLRSRFGYGLAPIRAGGILTGGITGWRHTDWRHNGLAAYGLAAYELAAYGVAASGWRRSGGKNRFDGSLVLSCLECR
jgi:hypothetical protein